MLYDAPARLEGGGDANTASAACELLQQIRPHVGVIAIWVVLASWCLSA